MSHPPTHSEFSRIGERPCDLTLALLISPFAFYSYISSYSPLILTYSVILLLCDHRVRFLQLCSVDAVR